MQSDSLSSRWHNRALDARVRSRATAILMMPLLALLPPGAVAAQMTSPTTPTVSSAASPFRTDPMYAPAFLDLKAPARYARYAPSFCDEIFGRSATFAGAERLETWHDRWPQTDATRQADSVYSAAARQAALAELRACLAPFNLANASPYQMWAIGTGWLTLGEEGKAAEAFTQFLRRQSQAPVEERAWWLQQLVSVYAGTGPAGLRTALVYLARLDSLGEPATGARITARNGLYGMGAAMDNIPFMREHATAARALSTTVTGERVREWLQPILRAVANLADIDYREGKAAVARDSLENAMKVYRPLDFMQTSAALGEPLNAAKVVAIQALAPEPKAMFVYYPGQTRPSNAFRDSLKGKPTLYVQLTGTRVVGQLDFGVYTLVSRVREQFGDRVNIVAVGTTRGSYAHRLVKDSVEAEQMRIFAHEYLHLPITLAIFSSQVTGKDEYGRLIRSSNPTALRPIVLADKRGVIRDLSRTLAPVRTMNMIAELLQQ